MLFWWEKGPLAWCCPIKPRQWGLPPGLQTVFNMMADVERGEAGS